MLHLLDTDLPLVNDWLESKELFEHVVFQVDNGRSFIHITSLGLVCNTKKFYPLVGQILYHFAMHLDFKYAKALRHGGDEGPWIQGASWDIDGEDAIRG